MIPAVVAVMTMVVAGCGGSSSSEESSMLFGKVPAIVAHYQTENDKLKEAFEKCGSESEGMKIFEQGEALERETLAKAEEAGQAWSGTTLNLASDASFEVKTPLSVTFDGFFSKSNFSVKYKLAGEIVTAKDLIWEPLTDTEKNVVEAALNYGIESYHIAKVDILGLDADGNEITSDEIGYVKLTIIDGKVGVAARNTQNPVNATSSVS